MTQKHLNSDQRQHFWMCLIIVCIGVYGAICLGGIIRPIMLGLAVIEGTCAISIYFGWRFAHWLYAAGSVLLTAWALHGWATNGYSHTRLVIVVCGLLSVIGFYDLRKVMRTVSGESEDILEESKVFGLPDEYEGYVDSLIEAYARVFGKPQWVHHIVPKPLWLHKYADHIITIPPTDDRPTWLYGTLLISALSDSKTELILERPKEDTIGAIGTLARLTEYYLDYKHLEEWNTMGTHPFFGEESSVRGLLFCKPPNHLPEHLSHPAGELVLRYVVGITENQLVTAQRFDGEHGDFTGAKRLYEELRIAEDGIANLPN